MNPRTRRVRQAILDAAEEVFLAHGDDQVTAARVAEHADVARTTIYRHWPDAGSLLLATIDHFGSPHFTPTSEGSLEADLRLSMSRLSQRLTQRKTRVVFSALAAQAHHSETFATAQRNLIAHLTAPIQSALDVAIGRGDLDASCNCELEAAVLVAPILHQHFMLYEKVTDDLIEATIRPWLAAHASN